MIVLDNKIRLRKADMKDIDALYEIKNDIKSASLLGGFSNGYSRKTGLITITTSKMK